MTEISVTNWYARVNESGTILSVSGGAHAADQVAGPGERIVPIPAKPDFAFAYDGMPHFLKKVDGTGELVDVVLPEPPIPNLDELKAPKSAAIMQLRDQKIDGGITFNSVRFQTRPDDRENIAGAAQLAFMAVVAGAQAGNLRWHGGATDFGWIAEDNSVVTMDAPTVIGFAKATAAFKSACIFYARALKDSVDAAADSVALDAIDITAGWPT